MARVWRRQYDPADPVLAQVRGVIGHLPEARTEETWGICTLRIGAKLFGWFAGGVEGQGRRLVFKPAASERPWLEADPRIRAAPNLTSWLELDLDAAPDWAEVRELLIDSYAQVAPKALADQVGGRPA